MSESSRDLVVPFFARITVAQDRGGFGCSPRTVREGKDGGILFSLLGDLIDLLVGERMYCTPVSSVVFGSFWPATVLW